MHTDDVKEIGRVGNGTQWHAMEDGRVKTGCRTSSMHGVREIKPGTADDVTCGHCRWLLGLGAAKESPREIWTTQSGRIVELEQLIAEVEEERNKWRQNSADQGRRIAELEDERDRRVRDCERALSRLGDVVKERDHLRTHMRHIGNLADVIKDYVSL